MVIVIGGAYQGKLDYVKQEFFLSENDIFFCKENLPTLDFSKKVLYCIDKFVLACIENDIDPLNYIFDNIEKLEDKIIVCNDISCGIVPIKYNERLLRDFTGKIMAYLNKKSDKVVRLFCGIPMNIK